MRCFWFSVIFTTLILNVISSNVGVNQKVPRYVLLTRSKIISGTVNRMCVSRLGLATQGTASSLVELMTLHQVSGNQSSDRPSRHYHKHIARGRKIFPQGHGGCIDVPVSRTPHRKILLHFKMRFESFPHYKVDESRELEVQHDANIMVIQTDKPLYRAGETVKFRVLQLRPDLTPQQNPVYRISIETPSEIFGGPVKVVQWFNISTQLGLVQREYQLDKYAHQGEWRIVVDSRDQWVGSAVQSFMVTEYSLPSFYLTVQHDKNVLSTFKQLVWSICARYMYGEGVNGKLDITVSSDSYDSQKINNVVELNDSRGCYNYTLRTKTLGFSGSHEEPKFVIANIGFQEEGTKVWKNTSVITHVSRQVVNVHYVNKYHTYFKLGLPYTVKVRVLDWSHKAVANATVQFCKILNDQTEEVDNFQESQVLYDMRTPLSQNNSNIGDKATKNLIDECHTDTTDQKGHALFTFTVSPEQNPDRIQLKTIVLDHPLHEFEQGLEEMRFASASLVMQSWGGAGTRMEVDAPQAGPTDLRVGTRHNFPIYLTVQKDEKIRPIILHYAFITRPGTPFRFTTTTQCPQDRRSSQSAYGTTTESSECPGQGSMEQGQMYRMLIPVKASHQMCPYSYLLVYFMRDDGELVVASRHFRVSDCFSNKVEQQWISDVVPPSSTARLQLRSVGPALCLLSVSNSALQHVATHVTVHDQIINRLTAFVDSRENQTTNAATGEVCFKDLPPEADSGMIKSYENTLKTFFSTGMSLLTDTLPQQVVCPQFSPLNHIQQPAELTSQDNYPKDRVYFPESWLWNIHAMDSIGILDITTTVPDEITKWDTQVYCISRFGIATSVKPEAGILKVMQAFFVDLVTPKVIKRGEDVHMFYKVFNYMDQDIPISIDLEIRPSAAVTIVSHEMRRPTGHVTCLGKGKSLVNHFTMRGLQLRNINVSVTVQIVNNMQQYCGVSEGGNLYDVRDKVVKEILVEPEGYLVEKHKSALLCVDDSKNKTDVSWIMEQVDSVDQSENWFVSLVGDITGPMAVNLERLISLPMGCGEQNMALLAYNMMALEYASSGKRISSELKEKALQNFMTGFQRQMGFRHLSGGFSAFGGSEPSASTWLTAFCVRHLPVLQDRWGVGRGIGEQAVGQAAAWLLSRQMENGCFVNEGRVFHKEMKGGLRSDTSSIALAAYVIISLIDSNIPNLKPSVFQNAAYCLAALKYSQIQHKTKGNTIDKHPEKMYAFSLATLAQIKIEKFLENLETKNEVLEEKRNFVKRQVITDYDERSIEHGNFREFVDTLDLRQDEYMNISQSYPAEYTLDEHLLLRDLEQEEMAIKESEFLAGGGVKALGILKTFAYREGDKMWWEAGSLSVSIETTGYAMLSMLALGGDDNILDTMAAARWLSLHRNAQGGFTSTQDTLIGLQALLALRSAMPGVPPSLSVTVRAPGRGRHFSVSPPERHKLHTVVFRAIHSHTPTKLSVKAEGRGCLLVQTTQRFNTLSKPSNTSPFQLFARVTTDGSFACKENQTWCMCAALLEVCVAWQAPMSVGFPEMALLEVQLPTGYAPDRSLLYRLVSKDNILLRRIEESAQWDRVFLYLSLQSQLSGARPSECYSLYLVGPKTHSAPATVLVYDYYHTETSQTASYTIPESCPYDRNRQPHEEPMDLVTQSAERSQSNSPFLETDDFDPSWHVIDTDYDLDTPKTAEGVPPVFVLPPPTFNKTQFD